jgi:hypothetical protein
MPLKWNEIENAPYDTPVRIKTGSGKTFRARLLRDISLNSRMEAVDQWIAEEGERYPSCWTEGACWESNHDEVMSDHPIGWMPA